MPGTNRDLLTSFNIFNLGAAPAQRFPANRTLLRRRATGPEAAKLVALHRNSDNDEVVMVFESAPPRGGGTLRFPHRWLGDARETMEDHGNI